jgi:hypothetical protein
LDAADKTNSDPELDDLSDDDLWSDDDSETEDEYDAPDVKDEENIKQHDGAEFAVASDVYFQAWQLCDILSDESLAPHRPPTPPQILLTPPPLSTEPVSWSFDL